MLIAITRASITHLLRPLLKWRFPSSLEGSVSWSASIRSSDSELEMVFFLVRRRLKAGLG